MTALPLSDKIHTDSDKQVKFRVLMAQFGDGYTQRAPDGINANVDSFGIIWPGLSAVDKNTVVNALESVGSWGVLTWQPPTEAAVNKFIIDPEAGYSMQYIGQRFTVSTRLIQVFDL